MGVDSAIPCGLIINELVSNCLEHPFKDGVGNEILIDIHQNHENIILSVGDNGVGIPEELDYLQTGSLGLQLVNTLAAQMEGEIELDREHGTKFSITLLKENVLMSNKY